MSSLAVVGTGGAAFPPNLLRKVHDVLPARGLLPPGYGMTETNGSVCSSSGEDFIAQPDSVGRILPIADVKVVDDDDRDLRRGRAR